MNALFLHLMGLTLVSANPFQRQLPPLLCPKVSTYTAPVVVVTYVEEAISTTSAIETITVPAGFTTTTTTTTSYSAVSATCFSSGTILTPTTKPLIGLPTPAPILARAASKDFGYVKDGTTAVIETFVNPLNPATCTAVEQDFVATTTTFSHVVTRYGLTTTAGPVSTLTFTKTVVQPTPAAYDGVNWYQYTNNYQYPGNGPPNPAKQYSGYGAGGYATSDWRGNYGYDDNGLQKFIGYQTTNYIPDPNGPTTCQLQGQTSLHNCAQWTVVFQGFIFAKAPGNFTFSATAPTDDELLFWGGDKAYRSYTDSNSDLLGLSGGNNEGKPTTFTYPLVAGQLFPITAITANGGGPARFVLDVSGPYVNSSDYLVPPCDASVFVP